MELMTLRSYEGTWTYVPNIVNSVTDSNAHTGTTNGSLPPDNTRDQSGYGKYYTWAFPGDTTRWTGGDGPIKIGELHNYKGVGYSTDTEQVSYRRSPGTRCATMVGKQYDSDSNQSPGILNAYVYVRGRGSLTGGINQGEADSYNDDWFLKNDELTSDTYQYNSTTGSIKRNSDNTLQKFTNVLTMNARQWAQWDIINCCGIVENWDCDGKPISEHYLPDEHIFSIRNNDVTSYSGNLQTNISNLYNLDTLQSLDKLSHINNDGSLAWIKNHDLSQSQAITEDDTIINNLYYPITSYSGEIPVGNRPDDDKLRAWCMSNSNTSNDIFGDHMVVNSYDDDGIDFLNKVNPDNPEKNSGILYNNWYNHRVSDTSIKDNTEIFDKGWSDINAYVHPEICEPWLLKASTNKSNPATYDNSLYWNHWNNYDPLNSNYIDSLNFWKINGNGQVIQSRPSPIPRPESCTAIQDVPDAEEACGAVTLGQATSASECRSAAMAMEAVATEVRYQLIKIH